VSTVSQRITVILISRKVGIIIVIIIIKETRRKGLDAVRSSPCSGNYKIGGICRQEGRPTNTGCQNTPTQNRLSSVTDS